MLLQKTAEIKIRAQQPDFPLELAAQFVEEGSLTTSKHAKLHPGTLTNVILRDPSSLMIFSGVKLKQFPRHNSLHCV
jgi:hypothetical protein